jgi:hypothetical protein
VVGASPARPSPPSLPTGSLRRPTPFGSGGDLRQEPRVVYFIASHVHPEQVVRLVRACRSGSPSSRVLLHHDYNVSYLDPQTVMGFGNVDVLAAKCAVHWGGFGTCALVLRCLRWLLDHHEFDWVVHLSGQDYPLRPLADIENELAQSVHDGYLLADPVEDREWDVGPARYLYQYYKVPRVRGWRTLRHWVNRHEAAWLAAGKLPLARVVRTQKSFRLGIRSIRGPFRDGARCYKGSSWWTLNRRSVEYMIQQAEQNPGLIRYYRRVGFAPNESFFQTILLNNPTLKLVADDHRRFIRWSHPETGHPDLLISADLSEMTTSGKDFARKIDSRKDPRIIDLLDSHLGVSAPMAKSGWLPTHPDHG